MNKFTGRFFGGMIFALVIGLAPQTVFAQKGGYRQHRPEMRDVPTTRIVDMMAKRLALTDDQKEKITPILESTRAQIRSEGGNAADTLSKAKEQISAILTDEQKAKMKDMKSEGKQAVTGWAKDHKGEIQQHVDVARKEIAVRAALASMDLTDDQKSKLKEIGKNAREQKEAIMKDAKPKLDALAADTKAKIEATLTDEQKTELKTKLSKMAEKAHKMSPEAGKRLRSHADGNATPDASDNMASDNSTPDANAAPQGRKGRRHGKRHAAAAAQTTPADQSTSASE